MNATYNMCLKYGMGAVWDGQLGLGNRRFARCVRCSRIIIIFIARISGKVYKAWAALKNFCEDCEPSPTSWAAALIRPEAGCTFETELAVAAGEHDSPGVGEADDAIFAVSIITVGLSWVVEVCVDGGQGR